MNIARSLNEPTSSSRAKRRKTENGMVIRIGAARERGRRDDRVSAVSAFNHAESSGALDHSANGAPGSSLRRCISLTRHEQIGAAMKRIAIHAHVIGDYGAHSDQGGSTRGERLKIARRIWMRSLRGNRLAMMIAIQGKPGKDAAAETPTVQSIIISRPWPRSAR